MPRLRFFLLALATTLCVLLPAHSSTASVRSRLFRPRDPVTAHYHRQPASSVHSVTDSPYNWTTLTYSDQYVDHFGFTEAQTFEQRYLVNTEYWRPPSHPDGPGPIFFYCGNEGYIETFAGNSGFMFDIAGDYGAMLLFLEHRYYGHSFPFGSAEAAYANTSTLQYLTSEQAIADFAQFLTWFKSDSSTACEGKCVDVPVIGFGGSYGGMLSSWMRMKYPHILAGAIAASAPIWQFYGLVAPTVYNSIVTRDYTLDTPNCAAGIQKGWDILDFMAQSKDGLQQLTNIFRPCNISTFTPDNVGSIWGFLSEAVSVLHTLRLRVLLCLPALSNVVQQCACACVCSSATWQWRSQQHRHSNRPTPHVVHIAVVDMQSATHSVQSYHVCVAIPTRHSFSVPCPPIPSLTAAALTSPVSIRARPTTLRCCRRCTVWHRCSGTIRARRASVTTWELRARRHSDHRMASQHATHTTQHAECHTRRNDWADQPPPSVSLLPAVCPLSGSANRETRHRTRMLVCRHPALHLPHCRAVCAVRLQDYQCCTEMVQSIGQYGGSNDMFWYAPFDLQGAIDYCQLPMSEGGWGTTPRPEWIIEESAHTLSLPSTTTVQATVARILTQFHLRCCGCSSSDRYGGLHIEAASRIFFSSGSLDPWSGLTPNATALNGVYSPSNPRGVVCYYMNHTAHHLDLRGANDADPPVVKRIRSIERAYITAWLKGEDRPSEAEVEAIERYYDQQERAAVDAAAGVDVVQTRGARHLRKRSSQ